MLKELAKSVLNRLPYISHLNRQLKKYRTWYPPGHYYSPVVDHATIGHQDKALFDKTRKSFPGIDLNEPAQLTLLGELAPFYNDQPFPEENTGPTRYYLHNDIYGYADGLMLHTMMRRFRPRQIVEIGSGFSSAVMLDTNERFFDGEIRLTFVEPYPERLYGLMKPEDKGRARVVVDFVQNVDMAVFTGLEAGDFLFIDSSHVSKTGSDVNHLYLEVLPLLKPGVIVHVHDVFVPFEYPREWIFSENNFFGFNELYLLRAFLMFNSAFEIILFTTFMEQNHRAWFEQHMPLCLKNPGGNIWIRRR